MSGDAIWAKPLSSKRLDLEPLRVEHAAEMAPLLDDPDQHRFIGGEPASLEQLRDRYKRQVVGRSRDGRELWLNWVLRRADNGAAVGTVQASITESGIGLVAELAWVIATAQQGRGFAREAAQAVMSWLAEQGVIRMIADVHPDHSASIAVARAIGLAPTDTMVDGEVRWQGEFNDG